MKVKELKVLVSESIGSVSVLISEPTSVRDIILLAHGAGAGMKHRFMENLAAELAKLGIGSIRYNFPFIEKGKKSPDVPAVAEKTVNSLLSFAKTTFPQYNIILGGKSFGGRMSSQYLSKNNPEGVKGIVFYGFPLHPPGKPAIDRAAHLHDVKVPMLFLQGSKDALADSALVEKVCSSLPDTNLIIFEDADHSFKVKSIEKVNELALNTLSWLEKL